MPKKEVHYHLIDLILQLNLKDSDLKLISKQIVRKRQDLAFHAIVEGIGWNRISLHTFKLIENIAKTLKINIEYYENHDPSRMLRGSFQSFSKRNEEKKVLEC